jgi:hypothetical protein
MRAAATCSVVRGFCLVGVVLALVALLPTFASADPPGGGRDPGAQPDIPRVDPDERLIPPTDPWNWDKIRENCRREPQCRVEGEVPPAELARCVHNPQCLYVLEEGSNSGITGRRDWDEARDNCRRVPNCLIETEASPADVQRCWDDDNCTVLLDENESKAGLGPIGFNSDWAGWLVDPAAARQFFLFAAPAGRATPTRGFEPLVEGFQVFGLVLLAVFATFGVLDLLLRGLVSGGNGFELVSAPIKTLGAGGAILAWPDMSSKFVVLERDFVGWLAGPNQQKFGPALQSLGGLFNADESFDPFIPEIAFGIPEILAFILKLAVSLVVLALSASKMMLTLSLALLILSMPVLFALWVLPGLAWLTNSAFKGTVAISLVPPGWAIGFRGYSEISAPFEIWAQKGSFAPEAARTLVAIVFFLLLFTICRQLLRWGNIVSAGSKPLSAAWGAVMGLGLMGASVAYGGATTAMRWRAGRNRYAEQQARWAQQDARTWASDARRGTSESRQAVQDAQRLSDGANREAEGIVRQTEGWARDAEQKVKDMRGDLDRTDTKTRQAAQDARTEKLDKRMDTQDQLRADAQKEAEARRELQWTPGPGANKDETGIHAPWRSREEAGLRESDERLKTRGAPDIGGVEKAWYGLSPEQRRGVQDSVWGVPHGKDPEPADRVLARAATTDGITPATRDSYQILLDAARSDASRPAFENVTTGPPDKGPMPSVSGGQP